MSACDDVRLALVLGGMLDAAGEGHLVGCDGCRADAAAARVVAAALAANAPPLPPPGLTERVLRAAAIPLAAHRRRVVEPDWRALARALGVAILPLPLLLYLDAFVMRSAYRLLTVVLPDAVSLYVVGSWAVVLALLLAVSYAAVPILAARQSSVGEAHA